MTNRDLDGKIAKDIFNWVYIKIGKDYNGKNACEILWKFDKIEQEVCNTLPFSGIIHETFLTPSYSSDLYIALSLAKQVGLDIEVKDLPLDAEKIAELSYNYFMENKKKSDKIDDIIIILKEKYPKIVFINYMKKNVDGINNLDRYSIIALKVPISKNKEIRNFIDNIFYKMIENNENIPLLFIVNKPSRKKGSK